MKHKITAVAPGSLAMQAGIEPGDYLCALNGALIYDLIDYQYLCAEEKLSIEIESHRDGKRYFVNVKNPGQRPLGLEFSTGLMSSMRMCANKCAFCFVDQMAPGCRQTLYVKDDDWRMSFIMGNFVTLTNVSDRELERIAARQVEPLYISVHATEPKLRCALMGNPRAGRLMEQLKYLFSHGVGCHLQLVLCPGLNDGRVLEQSLADLWSLGEKALSVAVVPVGLTRYRQNLPDIAVYGREGAKGVLKLLEPWRRRALEARGTRWVFPSDEFYVLAQEPVPGAEEYEDFAQIENGVGIRAQFMEQLEDALKDCPKAVGLPPRTLVTGVSAGPWLASTAQRVSALTGARLEVVAVENGFFGPTVTVAGLVTGGDILKRLEGRPLGDRVLIPDCMLRQGEGVFLDGMTVDQLARALKTQVIPVEVDGYAFLEAVAR